MNRSRTGKRRDDMERFVARWHTLAEAYEILARFQGGADGREGLDRARQRERAGRRAREK